MAALLIKEIKGGLFSESVSLWIMGGFHLVAKIIRELKSHMIPYKLKCSHWLKLQHSDWRANFPPMRALEFIRDHVTFKLPYVFSYHMKTPNESF